MSISSALPPLSVSEGSRASLHESIESSQRRLSGAVANLGAELLAPIGAGATGVVWRAGWRGRQVALKWLDTTRAGADVIRRFRREAELLVGLEHPNVVGALAVEEVDGLIIVLLPFIDGLPLSALVGRPWPAQRVVGWWLAIAEGLAGLHAAGLCHRDLSCANAILCAGGEQVRLIDLGLAVPTRAAHLSGAEQWLGTPCTLAPEVLLGGSGQATPAADVFAMGIIAYTLLTGWHPFAAGTLAELLERLRAGEVPDSRLLVEIPVALAELLDACLEPSPAWRPGASEVALRLRDWLTPPQPPPQSGRGWSWGRVLGAALLALVVAGDVPPVSGRLPSPQPPEAHGEQPTRAPQQATDPWDGWLACQEPAAARQAGEALWARGERGRLERLARASVPGGTAGLIARRVRGLRLSTEQRWWWRLLLGPAPPAEVSSAGS